ncbi:EAL domain-containing protein [Hydrogenophaga soli]
MIGHVFTGFPTRLELTESLLIEDPEHALTTLNGLKAMGVRLSIDDFGTGYSSLAYLKRFKVDRLKIDQSFVRDLRDNPDDAVIVQAIIQMAHSLGLVTIAEGVEDENTSQQLRDLGCDEAQGYFWGRPMDVKQVDEYLLKASSA